MTEIFLLASRNFCRNIIGGKSAAAKKKSYNIPLSQYIHGWTVISSNPFISWPGT
jgi:hypothetical protein